MKTAYNIYCDESCHLEHDRQKVMVLGAIWCPVDASREISSLLRMIKSQHSLSRTFELKWTKVSHSKIDYYLGVIRYFFDETNLHFRCLVVPDKTKLDHSAFNQDHDTFYYKMYFDLLKTILEPESTYYIYLDIKDTRSVAKVSMLHDVLSSSKYDFDKKNIKRIQQIRSHESDIMQLTDLFIGAVGYVNREIAGNKGKLRLIEAIQDRTGYSLTKSTLIREDKFNVFCWNPRVV